MYWLLVVVVIIILTGCSQALHQFEFNSNCNCNDTTLECTAKYDKQTIELEK